MILECCECSGSWVSGDKANDAAQRMSVAIPCGHLFHGACLEYARKRAKLVSRWNPERAVGSSADVDTQLRCPVCSTVIAHYTVMFCPPSSCSNNEAVQDRVFHLQRKLLMRLQACSQYKQELLQASTSCAQRFQEMSELKKVSASIHAEVSKFNAVSAVTSHGHRSSESLTEEALQDEVLNTMTSSQLAAFIRDQDTALRKVQCELADAQKLLTTKRSRYLALKQSLAELRIERARVASERTERQAARRRAPVSPHGVLVRTQAHANNMLQRGAEAKTSEVWVEHTDPTPDVLGVGASPDAPIDVDCVQGSSTAVVDVDVDSEDDDVVEWVPDRSSDLLPPENSEVAPVVDVPLLPCASRELPRYGLGTGRSLFDFPRPADAMYQPQIGRFLHRE